MDRRADSEAPRNGRRFRLGDWWVEPELDRIEREGETRRLEPKAMDLLVALAVEPGELVRRDDLVRAIWGASHLAPGALKHLVWQLRRDLGDDARRPRYVETIPRRGYRLVATVSHPTPADGDRSPPHPRSGRPGAVRWAIGLALASAVVVAATAPLIDRGTLPRVAADPLTTYPGNEVDPALDPSGTRVAFAWDGNGSFDIFLRALDEDSPTALTEDGTDEFSPVWSPDGTSIAFRRVDPAGPESGVFVKDVGGGGERRLAGPEIGAPVDLAWSPDGRWLAVAVRAPRSKTSSLRLLPLGGEESRLLTRAPESSRGDLDPAFSPDGSRIAFRRSTVYGLDDLLVVPVSGGEPRHIARGLPGVLGLAWSADGASLVFTSERAPRRSLWRVAIDGGEPVDLGLPGGFVADPSIAPDGTMVYQSMQCDSNLWARPLGSSEPAAALLVSTRAEMLPRYSPDGGRLAFLSERSGAHELWIARADGTESRRLTHLSGASVYAYSWSPTGDRIAFDARTGESSDVYVIDVAGGEPRRVTLSPADEIAPSWSADGQWLYYASDVHGHWSIWRRPVDGDGSPERIADGIVAQEDPTGRHLFVSRRDRPGLWRLPLTGDGPAVRVLESLSPLDSLGWTATTQGVYFVTRDGHGARLALYDDSGEVTSLGPLPQQLSYPAGFTVSPDGSRVIWTRLDTAASDLLLVRGLAIGR